MLEDRYCEFMGMLLYSTKNGCTALPAFDVWSTSSDDRFAYSSAVTEEKGES